MVDAHVSGACGAIREGSSPSFDRFLLSFNNMLRDLNKLASLPLASKLASPSFDRFLLSFNNMLRDLNKLASLPLASKLASPSFDRFIIAFQPNTSGLEQNWQVCLLQASSQVPHLIYFYFL